MSENENEAEAGGISLHYHVARTARDCDGTYHSDYVATRVQGEDDFDFQGRMLWTITSLHGLGGTLQVTTGVENGESWHRMEWSEPTEEGYTHVEAVSCSRECDEMATLFRDLAAEAAGY